MGKRFAIVIGVAAAGVLALGAQTAAAPGVVEYDTTLTLTKDRAGNYHGRVKSKVRKCMDGRRVILFKLRPGADRKLHTVRSDFVPRYGKGLWWMHLGQSHDYGDRVRAKVEHKVRDRFVCRGDRSPFSDYVSLGVG
jgi:hypothetical protein